MRLGKQAPRLASDFHMALENPSPWKDPDPADTHHLLTKEEGAELLQANISIVQDLQAKLFAQDQWALLLIFQAMDAAGQDGVIKHVFSGGNPQAREVSGFKRPSAQALGL